MPLKKTHKRRKSGRLRGKGMGGCGRGFRKKGKGTGHKGGKGMAGSGKRADHKKTLVTKLYGHGYFGKQGITSKKTERDKRKRINLQQIQDNIENFVKKGFAKKTSKGYEINLSGYKILGDGELKKGLIIKAKEASKSALEKIEKLGGQVFLSPKFVKNKQQTQAVKKAGGEIILSEKISGEGSNEKVMEKKIAKRKKED